jgi:hypothetical protein
MYILDIARIDIFVFIHGQSRHILALTKIICNTFLERREYNEG